MKHILIKLVSCMVIGWGGIGAGFAQDTLFQKANALYTKGDYSEAIDTYEQLLSSGKASVALFYNLGNAYFKSGQVAPAILNYEKALRLNPTDKDIIYNLQLANEQTVDRIDKISDFMLKKWLHGFIDILPSNAWAYLSVFSFIVCLLLFCLFLFNRRLSVRRLAFFLSILLLVCAVFSFFAAHQQKQQLFSQNEAIIFSPSVTVYSTPSDTGTELFLLHEGAKVKLMEKIGNWYRIQIADGNDGWVEKDNFRVISVN